MKHWLWIPVALATGCFSEPAEPTGSGSADTDDDTGAATTEAVASSTTGVGSSETTDEADGTDGSSEATGEPSETTDTPGSSSSTTASGPACGNGVVEGDEHCDGDDPQGAACLSDCTITCLDHYRDCDEMPAGGCEIDTATDGNNCGGCGHVCASGVCHDSACAPVAIADGIGPGPTRITRVGDTFVFDESGFGAILRWDLGSDEAHELVSDAVTGGFRRFAVANGAVHWLDYNDGSAWRVPLSDGTPEFMFSIDDAGSPFASDDHLYYPTNTLVDLQQVSTLLQATHESPAAPLALATDISGVMCQVVQAAGRIVWTGTDQGNPIQSILPDGSALESHSVLASDPCNRPVFGVGSSIYLYGRVLEAGPFGLIQHNLSTDATTMVIQEAGFGSLGDYFVSSEGILADVDGEVRAYDLSGNDPVVVAEFPPNSPNSAGRYIDDQVVMWTEVEGNTWTLFINERP